MDARSFFPLLGFVTFLALAGSARAGALVANPPDVVTTDSNNINQTANTLDVTNLAPAAVKIVGDANFTKTNAAEGTITAKIQGKVTASTAEDFFGAYDFSITLSGMGEVRFDILAEVEFPFVGFQPAFTDTSTRTFPQGGTQPFANSRTGDIPIAPNNQNFRATFTVTWTGPAGTLALNVPNNSIDLAIVPEPTSMALLGFAGIGLLSRRRR